MSSVPLSAIATPIFRIAGGVSEEITGRALKEFARREEIVIATKAWGHWGKGPNQGGLSRKALMQAIDDSLSGR